MRSALVISQLVHGEEDFTRVSLLMQRSTRDDDRSERVSRETISFAAKTRTRSSM
jgi:hypothetical protein